MTTPATTAPPATTGRVALTTISLGVVAVAAVALYRTTGVVGAQGRGGAYWLMLGGGALVLGVGVPLARRVPARWALLTVVAGAALMRLVLVPLDPALSTDLHRYLWDGQVQAEGINPYVLPPQAEELAHLRDDNWTAINRKFARTIYPPVAQGTFLGANLVGIETATAWKALVSSADLAAVLLLIVALRAAGRDPRNVVAYAWNPLPVMAFGLSGHVDAFVVLAVAGAVVLWWRHRDVLSGVLIGVAAGVKLFPLVLVAAFARGPDRAWRWPAAVRHGAVATGVLGAGYLFYLSAGTDVFGYLTTGYLEEEGYASADRFRLLRALRLDGRVVVPLVAVGVGLAVMRSTRPAPTRGAWLLGAAFVLTVPHSWYLPPLVALAVVGGAGWAWGWFAIALHAAYLSIFHDDALSWLTGGVRLSTPIRVVAAGAITLLALAAVRWGWARRAVIWQEPDGDATPGVEPPDAPVDVTTAAGDR